MAEMKAGMAPNAGQEYEESVLAPEHRPPNYPGGTVHIWPKKLGLNPQVDHLTQLFNQFYYKTSRSNPISHTCGQSLNHKPKPAGWGSRSELLTFDWSCWVLSLGPLALLKDCWAYYPWPGGHRMPKMWCNPEHPTSLVYVWLRRPAEVHSLHQFHKW